MRTKYNRLILKYSIYKPSSYRSNLIRRHKLVRIMGEGEKVIKTRLWKKIHFHYIVPILNTVSNVI